MRYAVAVLAFALFSPAVRAEEKTFDSNGTKIAYLDEGKGEAVVLLHGFSASSEEMWTKMPLAPTQFITSLKDYRVLAMDFRGHGKSDKPHDTKKYGKEMAEDVVRMLDNAKVKKAHVVGYSMGAMIAGKLLASHPDRLLSVTFGGASPLLPQVGEAPVLTATIESLEKGKGITPLITALTPEGQKPPTAEEAAAFSELFLKGKDQKALAAVLRSFPDLVVKEEELKAAKVPVQFVYGSLEAKFLKDGIAAAKKVLPKAGEVVVDKGDHGGTFMTPEFRKAVVAFLKANKE
ncbi:MAG: alpha/beta hydrolase [Planctomycetes bacterium]|nr:alpha/beta hydrolase [Planctomycetota bacterium]